VFVPNGTLEQFFEADTDEAARDRLGAPPGSFVITFAGTFGIAQALPTVLSAAALSDDRLHFTFIGEGPMRDSIVKQADDAGLRNVSFLPQVPAHEIAPFLAASDALLVPLSAHPTFRDFVPSKLIDFMAVGRPVLVAAAGESARLVERTQAGLVVPPEEPAALAEAAGWLANHPQEGATMGERGRSFARTRLRAAQAKRLEQILIDAGRQG
jgi:colanic acid biosynthesis glycosyl transferase WcaI